MDAPRVPGRAGTVPAVTGAPLVTIAISTYNNGAYLRPSVLSALDQTWADVEVVVVDDGSTDGSLDTIADIADPRLRRHRQDNAGKAAALNWIRRNTDGDYLMIQDGDDRSHPERAARQAGYLEANRDVALAMCRNDLLYGERRLAARSMGLTPDQCRFWIDRMKQPAMDPTCMIRRSATSDLDFDEELRIGQGFDYTLRVGERFPVAVLGDCLYSYRIEQVSTTRSDPAVTHRYVEATLAKAAARRGLPGVPPGSASFSGSRGPAFHVIVGHSVEAVIEHRFAGRRSAALRTGWDLARLGPGIGLGPPALKPLAFALVPAFELRRRRPDPTKGGYR